MNQKSKMLVSTIEKSINSSTFLPVNRSMIRMKDILYQSTITCPHCQNKTLEEMPDNYCQYLWICFHCHKQFKPQKGDCCIYCSYGSVKCPSIQKGECC